MTTTAAVHSKSHFNLSHKHICTNDFNRMKPIMCQYMVPGDSFKIDITNLTRLLPLPVPTMTEIHHTLRAFFVPCSFIMPTFNSFIRRQTAITSNGAQMVTEAPSFKVSDFRTVFLDPDMHTGPYVVSNYNSAYQRLKDGACDWFTFTDSADVWHCHKFSQKGRLVYDTLVSLGLNINLNYKSSDTWIANQQINALPIIALHKAYFDWVIPSRFVKSESYNIETLIADIGENNELDADHLRHLLRFFPTYLQNDYFTSAWISPFGPETNESAIEISQAFPNNHKNIVSTDSELINNVGATTHIDYSSNQFSGSFNQYTLQALGALQNLLNRGKLAGTKIQDWLKTEFGITPSNDALRLSTYLGSKRDVIQIGDVMSTSDTYNSESGTGVYLGQYAGKGIGTHRSDFNYSSDVHGYFIITSELTCPTSYWQGLRPEFSQIAPFDFFQPEFDNLGVHAIGTPELNNTGDIIGDGVQQFSPVTPFGWVNQTFGFTPNYSNLKFKFDTISGDFRRRSVNTGLDSWFVSRNFVGNNFNINNSFVTDSHNIKTLYDKIFSYNEEDVDHFYQLFYFKVDAYRPMHQISDALDANEFGHKKITVDTNGNLD